MHFIFCKGDGPADGAPGFLGFFAMSVRLEKSPGGNIVV